MSVIDDAKSAAERGFHGLFGGGDTTPTGGAGDLLQVDPDALLSFAQQLDERAADLERGLAAERGKVESALGRSGSMYTRDGRTAPVFKPMGRAVGSALDKAEQNVQALTDTLRNDAQLLRGLVRAHEEAERRAVRGWESGELQMKPR
ncbi:hypothetical protein [Mycobacteroides abscessus]|uniref:hypothetical protein n=1 Tax=Mycobacteroides abscessus TaxID=36809 RepID=UPI0009275255|nr:hypothetical protein [Mycobacteroides abscessus]SIE96716.1 Uncharacterised protein [Mycobacteroides abscessus subsp. abscessus]SKO98195.1 Uncharacterised protein [Mycobacteroides abscessus subsp. abscessus]